MKRTGCYERKLQRDHLDWRSWKASRSTIYQEKAGLKYISRNILIYLFALSLLIREQTRDKTFFS